MILPKTEEYAVAFVDFLGTVDLISRDTDGKLLVEFRAVCSIALNACKELLKEEDVCIKMFSDNVVLCKKVDSSLSNQDRAKALALMNVATATALLQYFALDKMGLLIRGGITIGELYIDELMVWGKALIDAYKVESTLAIYPRVVFDPSIIDTAVGQAVTHRDWIVKDEDGLFYLNYIKMIWETKDKDYRDEAYRQFWINNRRQIDFNKKNHRIIAKRYWHESYLNRISLHFMVSDVIKTKDNTNKSNEPPTPLTVDPTPPTPDV